jgi:hypothetical protein
MAQELVDLCYAGLSAVALQLFGERPQGMEEIERLRAMNRDAEVARKTLVDATCRLHYFIFRGSL